MRVLEAIADREDREPAELEPPLYEVVSPEALDDLFTPASDENSSRPGRVTFRYRGYDVTVHASGDVDLA